MGTSHLFVNTIKPMQGHFQNRANNWQQSLSFRRKKPVQSMTVGRILSTFQPFPANAVLLGSCEDGLPFLMTFSDPEIGAILVGGDAGCGKTHQLQVMVDSAFRTHSPKDFQVVIFTHKPDEWVALQNHPWQKRYLQVLRAWYDRRIEKTIDELVDLAVARRDGDRTGPAVMLIMDDFNFIETLSLEVQVNLRWLLDYGPQSNVWPIAAMNAGFALGYRYWMEAFRTRIIGRVTRCDRLEHLTLLPGSRMKSLGASEFRVWTGSDWLTYQIPLLGDAI